jgi:hypothetical protein
VVFDNLVVHIGEGRWYLVFNRESKRSRELEFWRRFKTRGSELVCGEEGTICCRKRETLRAGTWGEDRPIPIPC